MAFGRLGAMGTGFGKEGAGGKKGVAGPVLWTPLNDPNLVAWWDPQATSNITFNGSFVSAIADRKAGLVASQGTGANQPSWNATTRNGKAGLSWSAGQNMSFSPASFPSGSGASSVLVAAFHISSASNSVAFSWGDASGTGTRAYGKGNTNLGLFSSGSTNQNTAESFAAVDRLLIQTLPAGASPTSSLYVDGNAAETQAYATFNTPLTFGIIGGWTDATNFLMNGSTQQIVVANAVWSTSVRQKYEGWESWYDGKAGANLPGGHPYKSRAPFVSDP